MNITSKYGFYRKVNPFSVDKLNIPAERMEKAVEAEFIGTVFWSVKDEPYIYYAPMLQCKGDEQNEPTKVYDLTDGVIGIEDAETISELEANGYDIQDELEQIFNRTI